MAWPENVLTAAGSSLESRLTSPTVRPLHALRCAVHHRSRVCDADVDEMVDARTDRRGDGSFDRSEIHASEL